MPDDSYNMGGSLSDVGTPSGWKGLSLGKKLAIAASAAVALATLAILAWYLWPKGEAAVPANENQAVGQPSQSPAVNAAVPVGNENSNVQAIQPGIDRPVTAEERQKYGFSSADDIWVKTTSPTDGSAPQMSFYNKTINPSPKPYVRAPDYKK